MYEVGRFLLPFSPFVPDEDETRGDPTMSPVEASRYRYMGGK
jgi:hypothetical protein